MNLCVYIHVILVSDVKFDDVMCIPLGQPDGKLFTRPFLVFCIRRGWLARLLIYSYTVEFDT